jgi:phenylacetate-CoA ligase
LRERMTSETRSNSAGAMRGHRRADLGVQSPRFLSGLKSEFIRRVLFPVVQKKWHPSARRYLVELRRYEFASLESIETIQWRRLQAMIRHAALHVPYYRKLFRSHGLEPRDIASPGDLARLPILTKATLQEKLDELFAENLDRKAGLPNASGGSTGTPVQFFQDGEYWDRAYANQWFVESWWGIRPGDRTASLWGADRDIPDQSLRERFWGEIGQLRVCNAFALTLPRMERFAKMLVAWQPRYVIGYASALEIFARFVLDRPELRIRAHAIKTTADVLTDERRKVIELAFGCPVYNFYGSREINNLAAECPARSGLHVNALTRYIEVVDDAGNALPPGVPGRILLTDLSNYFMPLIRYEIQDIGSWKGQPCECGRQFPLLERIWGRASDFIVTPEGKMIHSVFFTHLFYDMSEVALFQIHQMELRDIRVYLVLRPGVTEYPAALLRERLLQAFGAGVTFCVQVVPKIERPPSGKHRFTVSSVRPIWEENNLLDSELRGVAQ